MQQGENMDKSKGQVLCSAVTVIVGLMVAIGAASPAQAQGVQLAFDTLPSAQGWTYITSGPDESSIFSADGTTLHQNSLGTSLGPEGTVAYYTLNNVVDPTQLFTLTVRARVLLSERFDTGDSRSASSLAARSSRFSWTRAPYKMLCKRPSVLV
jgi:hypothetical protein